MKRTGRVAICLLLVCGLVFFVASCGGGGGSGGTSHSIVGSWTVVDTTASKSYIGNIYTARSDGSVSIFYFNLGYRIDGTYTASGNVVTVNVNNDLIVHYSLEWIDANNVKLYGNGFIETLTRM